MNGADTGRTTVDATFAGQRRRFRLRLGEMAELERLCGAGVGEIMVRLSAHRFRAADIRETIRLGLEGGGTSEPEATALVMRYVDEEPLSEHMALAGEILNACVTGVPASPGKPEGESESPEISPPSTPPAPRSASRRTRSTG